MDLDSRHVIITCGNCVSIPSSTKEKFSRHLIFVTPGACFSSLHHVGMYCMWCANPTSLQ